MSKTNFVNSVKRFGSKHGPTLLMCSGLLGLGFSTFYCVRATVRSVRLCDEKKKKENKEKLTFKEIFKTCWKEYIPVASAVTLSIPCLIIGNRISNKRYTAAAAAYTSSVAALQEYKDATKEAVGDKKFEAIEQKVAQEQVEKTLTNVNREILMTNDDEIVFLESLTGRYFKSTWNKIQDSCNRMNELCVTGSSLYFSMNEWFSELGLDTINVMGDDMGWGIGISGGKSGLLKIHMSSCITPDKKPCAVIEYDVLPRKVE